LGNKRSVSEEVVRKRKILVELDMIRHEKIRKGEESK